MKSLRTISFVLPLLAGCGAALSPAGVATPLTTELFASGLERPVFVTHAPGDFERVFVIEKRGRIRVILNGALLPTPFLDIDAIITGGTSDNSEQGLLGLAFHPEYQNNGLFYVNYTDTTGGDTIVAQYQVTLNPSIANPASAVQLIEIDQPQTNHNCGWMSFGPDGYLYIGTGDGGGADDNDTGHTLGVGNGQDITDNLLGKILRVDVDGDDFPADATRNYAVPFDNPFVGVSGDDEIWAFGLRNPWRNAFDRETGDLWIADVGQGTWEEVDFQDVSSAGGENYGWRCREGAHDFNTTGDCSQTPFTEPIHEYSHGGAPFRCSITGGYVYRGCAIPDLQGTYFFADWCSDQVWSMRYDGVNVLEFQDRTTELAPPGALTLLNITSFGEDAYGELYICDQNEGEVFKIVPNLGGAFIGGDCNENGIDDSCDIFAGTSADQNGDSIPDECQCLGDLDGDEDTDLSDLALLLAAYGSCTGDGNYNPAADLDNSGCVNLADLAALLSDYNCDMTP